MPGNLVEDQEFIHYNVFNIGKVSTNNILSTSGSLRLAEGGGHFGPSTQLKRGLERNEGCKEYKSYSCVDVAVIYNKV
jgi:hypothetical protein